ncbi:PKD domain-containing protein [Candidatus Parcubacteria bacterium]|nr:PKD domain-containing protein [Candidatus Parcubacteria bacterium]
MSLSLVLPGVVRAAEESGSIGIEGKISAAPPSQAATIAFPRNGAVIKEGKVTVTGLCPADVIVKVFKNNVFAGAAPCVNGSYSVQIDLFGGTNELVARVFDDLDQQGPDSNKVTVTYPISQFEATRRVTLTSTFAKKGANPGATLTWPIILSGGSGPYAITVDWGDGKPPDVISQEFAGTFNIEHVYDTPGVYTIIVRAADKNGSVAFLQLIGIANGKVTQDNQGDEAGGLTKTKTIIMWQPVLATIPLIAAAFWLGRRHELQVLRKRLEKK